MSEEEFEAAFQKAVRNVAELDRADGQKDRHLKTVIAALVCGLNRPDTNAHFDALVMLIDLVESSSK